MEQVIIIMADKELKSKEQEEFKELVAACDMEIVAQFSQLLKSIRLHTYIGKGKCEEIAAYLQDHKVDSVVFNQVLSPLQIRNLEDQFQTTVLDRTDLILAIFQKRAASPAARLQIESAQLKKLLPRLIGANTQLGRQSASGKNKGTGEKQLELDRRRINARIHEVDRELKKIEAQRHTQRRARQRSQLPLVALVGYTNAGKSTIMNQLLRFARQKEEKQVLEKDMLFATLDTSVRSIACKHGHSFLLSDTVGFVSHLPHELITAFHSTLEEVKYADLLLQIVDASDTEKEYHMQVTMDSLREIGAADIPMITVLNKCDQSDYHYPHTLAQSIYISAKEDDSITALLQQINTTLFHEQRHVDLLLPYAKTNIYASLMRSSHVLQRKDQQDGMHIEVLMNEDDYQRYHAYVTHRYD